MVRYNEIIPHCNSFINDRFSDVKTQQSPCCFRICQSYLQAGIIKSVLQWQRREPFKGAYNLFNFHYCRKFGCKYKKKERKKYDFYRFLVHL